MIDCVTLDDFNDLLGGDLIEVNLTQNYLLNFSDI
jgi:hypothetical protein